MEVIAVAETHIHADFLSGSRELSTLYHANYMYLMKGIVIGNINILRHEKSIQIS